MAAKLTVKKQTNKQTITTPFNEATLDSIVILQVALCAGCNVVHPYAAFVIGIIAGIAYVAWSTLVVKLKIDDPLDAVAGKKNSKDNE